MTAAVQGHAGRGDQHSGPRAGHVSLCWPLEQHQPWGLWRVPAQLCGPADVTQVGATLRDSYLQAQHTASWLSACTHCSSCAAPVDSRGRLHCGQCDPACRSPWLSALQGQAALHSQQPFTSLHCASHSWATCPAAVSLCTSLKPPTSCHSTPTCDKSHSTSVRPKAPNSCWREEVA